VPPPRSGADFKIVQWPCPLTDRLSGLLRKIELFMAVLWASNMHSEPTDEGNQLGREAERRFDPRAPR